MILGWMCVPVSKLFLIMGEIGYCFNYLESDYIEALPTPPTPGLLEQFSNLVCSRTERE